MFKKIRIIPAILSACLIAACGAESFSAKTTHDELNYTVTVNAKRSTVTVKPNDTPDGSGNNHVINPDAPGMDGVSSAFTVTGRVGDDIMIYGGSADAAYIDHLEESDPSSPNVVGFTYRFGPEDETVTVHWKPFTTYFNGNGGTADEASKTTEYNQVNTMPGASTGGYDFAGWYSDALGGTSVGTTGTQYTQGATEPTYYAHWTCNHEKPYHTWTTSYGAWGAVNGEYHQQTATTTCDCGAVLATEYPKGGHSDGNNDGICDICSYNSRSTVTYTLKYKKTSSDSTHTTTQSGTWGGINNRWINGGDAGFVNLGMSSSHYWYLNNWKGNSGAVNTGCVSVKQLRSAGYGTGTYYKKDY